MAFLLRATVVLSLGWSVVDVAGVTCTLSGYSSATLPCDPLPSGVGKSKGDTCEYLTNMGNWKALSNAGSLENCRELCECTEGCGCLQYIPNHDSESKCYIFPAAQCSAMTSFDPNDANCGSNEAAIHINKYGNPAFMRTAGEVTADDADAGKFKPLTPSNVDQTTEKLATSGDNTGQCIAKKFRTEDSTVAGYSLLGNFGGTYEEKTLSMMSCGYVSGETIGGSRAVTKTDTAAACAKHCDDTASCAGFVWFDPVGASFSHITHDKKCFLYESNRWCAFGIYTDTLKGRGWSYWRIAGASTANPATSGKECPSDCLSNSGDVRKAMCSNCDCRASCAESKFASKCFGAAPQCEAASQATTTTAAATTTRLTGSMNMNVANPQAAVNDNAFKTAVEAGTAQTCGVPTSYVTASLSIVRRLSDIDRRLAGVIKVDYTVDVPASSSVTAATAKSALESATVSELASAIKTKLSSATLANATNAEVIVTSKGTVTTTITTGTSATSDGTSSTSLASCTTPMMGMAVAVMAVITTL